MSKLRLRLIAFALAVAVVWLLLSCGSSFSWGDESPSYLEETSPACTPIRGSAVDPCESRDDWIVRLYPPSHVMSSIRAPDLPIDVEARYRRMWQKGGVAGGLHTPQIVIRGTAVPNSSRCTEFSDYVFGLDDDGPGYSSSDHTGEVCFVDVSVSEYIVGTGPGTVLIVVGWRNGVSTTADGYGTSTYYAKLVEPIEEMMGGFEFVIALARPLNMAWGEWGLADVWDVQRGEDGTTVSQHELYPITGNTDNKTDYEYPLADLQRKIRDAHAKLSTEFDGRIGGDADAPKVVTDANREFLLEQLRELGAYDVPGRTPMPAPSVSPPGTPTGLIVTRWMDPDLKVDLEWYAPASSYVTGYRVERKTGNGAWETLHDNIPAEDVETSDRHLQSGTSYTYRVVAYNAWTERAPSAEYTLHVP